MSTNVFCPGPTRPVVVDDLIVARGLGELCQALHEAIARGHCTVIVDGRDAERRRGERPVLEERRRGERRRCPAITADPPRWPDMLVGPHSRPPLN
jgi:hypothetical protein